MADLKVITRTGQETTLKEQAIRKFAENLRGKLIQPNDTLYEESRKVYNAMHDRRPALIVHAAGVADVIAAVRFARENDLLLAESRRQPAQY